MSNISKEKAIEKIKSTHRDTWMGLAALGQLFIQQKLDPPDVLSSSIGLASMCLMYA